MINNRAKLVGRPVLCPPNAWIANPAARAERRAVHGEPERVGWQAAARWGLRALPTPVANDIFSRLFLTRETSLTSPHI